MPVIAEGHQVSAVFFVSEYLILSVLALAPGLRAAPPRNG